MTDETFREGMAVLFMMWPSRAKDEATVAALCAIYRPALDDLSDARFRRAVAEALKTCTYFPVPAELRALARGRRPGGSPEEDHDPIAAWRAGDGALPAGPALLAERAVGPEQAAERERQAAERRAQLRAHLAALAGQARRRAGGRRAAYPFRAEAEALLASLRGQDQPDRAGPPA